MCYLFTCLLVSLFPSLPLNGSVGTTAPAEPLDLLLATETEGGIRLDFQTRWFNWFATAGTGAIVAFFNRNNRLPSSLDFLSEIFLGQAKGGARFTHRINYRVLLVSDKHREVSALGMVDLTYRTTSRGRLLRAGNAGSGLKRKTIALRERGRLQPKNTY